jgi:putative DNA methylase
MIAVAMWLWTLSTDVDEEVKGNGKTVASTGYELEYDAARKIAQGLGAYLEQLGNLVEIKGSTARLLPVAERTRYLFGKEGIKVNQQKKRPSGMQQLSLLSRLPEEEIAELRLEESAFSEVGQTVLDKVHQSMLLFAAGQSEALKRLLVDDGIGQDEHFWRLAQALSALYPPFTDEKRWVDGVLARKKGLGL